MHHDNLGLRGTLGYTNKIEVSGIEGKEFVGIKVTQMEISLLNGRRNQIVFAQSASKYWTVNG